jgi:type III secretion protein Q
MDSSNDLEIRLSFELDRRLITVGELSSIAPGFTFPLTNPADSLVTIRANGKAIARGRIVDMNGTLGVQVTETL